MLLLLLLQHRQPHKPWGYAFQALPARGATMLLPLMVPFILRLVNRRVVPGLA